MAAQLYPGPATFPSSTTWPGVYDDEDPGPEPVDRVDITVETGPTRSAAAAGEPGLTSGAGAAAPTTIAGQPGPTTIAGQPGATRI
ncbi:hypothetical protein [Mumia sp. DW29H23]|uniref:hypothetical protein n=1 Tax=Mumia sp. DW29H23 TaxID=3421241 RepID=UPI003D68D5AF